MQRYDPSPAAQDLNSSTTNPMLEEGGGRTMGSGPEISEHSSIQLQNSHASAPFVQKRTTSQDQLNDANSNSSLKSRFLLWFDAYKVEERQPDRVGLFVTFIVIPLAIAYSIFFLFQSLHAPDPVKTELLWAGAEGPFDMPVRCEARDGCLFSNSYQKQPRPCESLQFGQQVIVPLEYSANALDGPSFMAVPGSSATAIVTVLSETYMAMMEGADSDGTFLQWAEVSQGTVVMTYVHTLNETAKDSGRDREEFFNMQVNTDGTIVPGSSPCADQAVEGMREARIRVNPAITIVKVHEGFNVWQYIGVCSGQYAALLSWGALAVALVDSYKDLRPR